MEKIARKPSADPVQEKLRSDKASWNKDVSAFINDLIHIKKTMNGWPSKFFKERSRITQPIPADPGTVIGALAGDFQDIVNRGNAIIQEQIEYAKNRRQKQPKPVAPPIAGGPAPAPTAPAPSPAPDLSQQLGKQLAAIKEVELVKLASIFESKYELESMASNPFSRFITKLFNPKFGFGEAARIRRLRMAMLDHCVKSYKELKKLHKEIVKSSKASVTSSYKMTTQAWNYWNAVNRLFATYKSIRPNQTVADPGGVIEDPDLKKERDLEEGREVAEDAPAAPIDGDVIAKLKDYRAASGQIGALTNSQSFRKLNSLIEAIIAAPNGKKADVLKNSNIDAVYAAAIQEVNAELSTNGTSFMQIAEQLKNRPPVKAAQKLLGKVRHQILPGPTSGQRLEIYQFINQVKKDMDGVMNLLESGFDQEALVPAIAQVNREMSTLRLMVRSLHASENPTEISTPFF